MILNTPDFNLEATLESGQVFGFEKTEDGAYEGIIDGNPVHMRQIGQILHVRDRSKNNTDLSLTIQHFFHLDFDLKPVYHLLSNDDPCLMMIFQKYKGLRIIRQNFWEALVCFIISANNNIKRIQKIRRNLARAFSSGSGLNLTYLSLPSVHQIAASSEPELRSLGLGYRAPFLLNTAKMIARNPNILNDIRKQSYAAAKAKLLEFPGVGEKVADCVLLFGMQKYEAFPVDTWIAQAMRKLYFRNRKTDERKIQRFGQSRWKQYAGYIQQYLFHGAKTGILQAFLHTKVGKV